MIVHAHYFPNPISVVGRKTETLVLSEPVTYGQIRTLIGAPRSCVIVSGGEEVDENRLVDAPVVSFHRKAEDPVGALAFAFVDAGIFFGFELAAATLFVQAAAAFALNYAVNAVFKADEGSLEKTAENSPNAYSVSAASNSARGYQPLPVVMGTMRMSPDLDSRPWTQFVNDPENVRQQTYYDTGYASYTAATADQASDSGQAAFAYAPANGADFGYLTPWNYPAAPILQTTNLCWVRGQGAQYITLYHNVLNNLYSTQSASGPWVTFTAATEYYYEELVTAQVPETTVQLNEYFNFGLGDLTITDTRFGQTPVASYKGVLERKTTLQQDRSAFLGLPNPDAVPVTYPLFPNVTYWRNNVISVEGGELRQNAAVTDNGWVTRSSYTDRIIAIQVDISGSLWYSGNNGPEVASVSIEIQAREVGGAWTTPVLFPLSNPFLLSNADSFPVRRTLTFSPPGGSLTAQYEVRVRKITTDSTDARLTQDFEFTQVKFIREDYSSSVADSVAVDRGAAQNRYAISMRAGGQINGSIDNFNALVTAKCWVWTGGGTPSAAPPAAGWSWQATDNPAWWYLYWLMGVFRNRAAQAGHPLNGQGWMVGTDLSDGVRLAGCGLEWDRIDIESIVNWAAYCTSSNLTFGAVLTEQSSAFETLTKIARVGRGSPSWHTGKLGVIWEDPNAVPVASFGMTNIIIDTFQVNYLGENVPEEIVVSFIDPDEDWKENEVRKIVPGYILPNNELQVRLWGCKSKAQAQREANLLAARQFFQRRRITFQTAQEGLLLRRGDVILIGHDLTQWAATVRLADGSAGTFVRLVRRLEDMGALNVAVRIVAPDGSSQTGSAGITEGDHEITVSGVNVDFSLFPDAVPEDWVAYISPYATPGKKFRVTSIEPADGRIVSITAADERPEMWAFEYSGTPVEADLGDSGERLVAKIQGLTVTEENCEPGWYRIEWECVNARGAVITIQPPGSPAGSYSTIGEQLLLQGPITTGTIFQASPLLEIPAVASKSDTYTME